ncbi:helix-turn-helix domain-containing protein [Paraburkholderia gardini]|uniref:hypothetical protein n=1 Tax=Paraburkholderia gardini TaxID=2823469 RepID=UPI001E5EBBB5|nr:hypothetical protein [Paraburkholderia gardini]
MEALRTFVLREVSLFDHRQFEGQPRAHWVEGRAQTLPPPPDPAPASPVAPRRPTGLPLAREVIAAIQVSLDAGESVAETARTLGLSITTVYRHGRERYAAPKTLAAPKTSPLRGAESAPRMHVPEWTRKWAAMEFDGPTEKPARRHTTHYTRAQMRECLTPYYVSETSTINPVRSNVVRKHRASELYR